MSTPAQKKAARKKLLAKLGIEYQSLATTCLNSGGGAMKRNEYKMFWEQVDGPTEATWLLGEVATQINKQLELGVKATQVDATNAALGAPVPVGLDSLLTTFNFILLTQELLTAAPKIKEVLTNWAKIESVQNSSKNLASQHPLFPQAKEVYRMLNLRVENHELIGPLILNCISMYGSIKEFERMMDILNYSTIDDYADLKGGESSFYYEYLKRLAKDGFAVPNTTTVGKTVPPAGSAPSTPPTPQAMLQTILSNTVSKIITLPQQMKMNPKVAETTFCALFHLLKNLMSIHAISDTNFIRMTLATLQPFYLWPHPYGIQTRELLIQLQVEALLAGSLLRARLDQETHTTPYVDLDASPSQQANAASSASATGGASGELTSALFYLYSQDDKLSQAYVSILDLKPWKQQSTRKSPNYVKEQDDIPVLCTPTIQAHVILNLFACEPSFQSGLEEDVTNMRQCNNESVFILYKKTQSMIKDILDRPNESKEIRLKSLTEIRSQLKQFSSSNDKKDLIRLPEKLVAPFSPPLPSISHLSLSTPNTSTFHFDPRDQWRMIGHRVAPFVHVPIFDELVALFGMYRDSNRVQPLTLRLMISGADELLHQIICAWCSIKQTKPELLDGLAPKFYLLPFSRNHLSSFLARHDSWYNRHIYVPCRSNTFMTPWIKVDQNDMDSLTHTNGSNGATGSASSSSSGPLAAGLEEEGAELPPPGQFFRRSFESYAREAQITLEPYIYQLEGYTSAESEGLRPSSSSKTPGIPGPDQLVPFFQRAEIGVLPAASDFRRMKKFDSSVRLEDIASGVSSHSKGFEYIPTELTVKFTKMDIQGRISEVITEDPTFYQSLLISNVPRKNDITSTPNPTYPNLELGARLHKTHNTQKSTNLGRKHILSTDSKQHVVEVEIWATNPNQSFGIMLDNQYFGPFYRVKLLPCFETFIEKGEVAASSSGKRMKFPIQAFFPMDM
jgi:hypothetical protein